MLIRNWNPVDDNYLNSEEVRQQEDTREAQYQRDMEKYKLSINGDWLAEKPNKRGIARFSWDPKEALTMHLPELRLAVDRLGSAVAYGTVVWHYRPIARLDVDTAKLLLSCTENEKGENRYIVQHNNGWVSNDLFRKCYHWQIATPYTLEDAYRIAKGHRGMNEAIGDYSEVWVLRLGWAKEQLSDVMSRRWLVSTN